MLVKQNDTFSIVYKTEGRIRTVMFHIVGYDSKHINNVYVVLDEMLTGMKTRGDFLYDDPSEFVEEIIDEAWRFHVHLEYDYPTYGTYNLNLRNDNEKKNVQQCT